ncbi:MAG: helix-hairpin-helix domain-containing protein [Gemmatimonadaceae bacterium]
MTHASSKAAGLLLLILTLGVGGRLTRSIGADAESATSGQPELEAQLRRVDESRAASGVRAAGKTGVGGQTRAATQRAGKGQGASSGAGGQPRAGARDSRSGGGAQETPLAIRSERTAEGALDVGARYAPARLSQLPHPTPGAAPRGASRNAKVTSGAPANARRAPAPSPPVNLDVASREEIERLPRIGPALAARIVEDRSAHGAFGSLDGLQRVKGVGPGIARLLAGRVTFELAARPSHAEYPPR